jgi:predicted PurR-regulated permease PerM
MFSDFEERPKYTADCPILPPPAFGGWCAPNSAVLIAFLQSLQQGFRAARLYIIFQRIEGYFHSPTIGGKSIKVPRVSANTIILLLGFAFGLFKLMIATPLAALIFLVKMLYVEDVSANAAKQDDRW